MINNKNDPRFSSDIGYLALLDGIIRLANNHLIEGNIIQYANTLESWYLEIQPRAEILNEYKKHYKEKISKLRNMINDRKKPDDYIIRLKEYQSILNLLTHKAKLRLRDSKNTLGVLTPE
jgi:hypothetical protein